MSERYILLIEDNRRDVEIILSLLHEAGTAEQVVALFDGEEAIQYFTHTGAFTDRRADEPYVILLDVKMPKVNGLEFLEWIRRDPNLRKIAVILLTSSRQEKDLMAAYDLQADGYLIKPAKPQQLASTIESAVKSAANR